MAGNRKRVKPSTRSNGSTDAEVFTDSSDITRRITQEINNKFAQFKEEVIALLDSKDSKIAGLEEEINCLLKKNLAAVDERCDEADAYERRDTVIVSGGELPVPAEGENCSQVFCNTIKNKVSLIIKPSDISVAHRLGRKPASQSEDRRGIIVKLCRRDLMKACKSVKPPRLYVNESLTPTRNAILYGLRQAKKKFPDRISGYGSIDGKVFVWIKPANSNAPNMRNSKMFVNNKIRFDALCSDILKYDSSQLVSSWPNH